MNISILKKYSKFIDFAFYQIKYSKNGTMLFRAGHIIPINYNL